MSSRSVVVIPLKQFTSAKSRLHSLRPDVDITALSRQLAAGVIAASAPRDCVVVCDDDDVATFGAEHGARVLRVEARGLNQSVNDALDVLRTEYSTAVIAHGDLARPHGLGAFEFVEQVTVVTDRHERGTNVLALALDSDFHVQYGDDSATRHVEQAHALGLSVRVITNSSWGLDIDEPADWDLANKPPT